MPGPTEPALWVHSEQKISIERKKKDENKQNPPQCAQPRAGALPCFRTCLRVFRANANQAVLNDKSGVLRVNLVYTDAAGREWLVKAGSGFLVNETYLVTCNHVVTLSDEEAQELLSALTTYFSDGSD